MVSYIHKTESAHTTYYEHSNHGNHTNHDSEAIIVPASAVCEVEDRIVYVAMWRQDPKWYHDYEYTQDMENEDDCFGQWQPPGEEDVE